MQSLADIADRKTVLEQVARTELLQHKASRIIQRMFWHNQLRAHPEPNRLRRILQRLASRRSRRSDLISPLRIRFDWLCRTYRGQLYSAFGVVWASTGLVLWFYVQLAIDAQQAVCVQKLGDIAPCLRPRPYFASGLFAQTECHFERAVEAACDAGRLGGGHLLEAPSIYASMANLTRINVSHNPKLRTVPRSWSYIPNLQVLDAAGSAAFHGLPWSLCNDSISDRRGGGGIELNLSGTNAAERIDWSGQLTTKTGIRVGITTACANALRGKLKSIDLSGNNLTLDCERLTNAEECYEDSLWIDGLACTKPTCGASRQLGWIRHFTNLESLNLADNGITVLTTDFFAITAVSLEPTFERKQRASVDLTNNPLHAVLLSAISVHQAVRILRHLNHTGGQHCLPITSLMISGIFLANNSRAFDRDVLGFLRDACFRNTLTHLHIIAIPWWGIGPDGSTHKHDAGMIDSSPPSAIEPGSFETLSSLLELKIAKGLFSGLRIIRGEAFRGLYRLERLVFVETGIKTLEDGAFSGLAALKQLIVLRDQHVGQQLVEGPELATVGIRLRELDLSRSIPDEFKLNRSWLAGLTNLDTFKLANSLYCKVGSTIIEAGAFVSSTKLRVLDLSGHNLMSANLLDGAIFDGLSSLETLMLSYNMLSTNIKNDTFSRLTSLKTLYIWPQGGIDRSNFQCAQRCNADGGGCLTEATAADTQAWGLPRDVTVAGDNG